MRKKAGFLLGSVMIVSIFASLALSAMTAEEIIRKRDHNEYINTAKAESEMIIVSGNRSITKTMVSYVEGDNGLTVFTNPRDRDTKFLKRGDDLWMFFPEAEDCEDLRTYA